jgi:hypothetical protein
VTSGFQVVLADLRRAAGAFGTESVTFWGIMPPDGPESVSGGCAEFDGALAQVLEAIGGRHTELAAAIAGHGRKLREAYKNYRNAEETVGYMVDRIMDHGAPG